MLVSLALLWPGTFASVAGYLAGGSDEKLREVQALTVFVLGASSPMPVSQASRPRR
ncbi:MAG TPA: hypothetical protein VFU36_14735 [Jatrophihabitans sp.]|nr:hypothetical protein [Jatrophihabitans sp.]